MIPSLLSWSGWALVLLRVVYGALFFIHGVPKLKNLKGTNAWFDSVGFKPGVFWGTLVALLEVVGGAFLVFGLWVQPIALLLVIQMVVGTFWKISQKQKFAGGWELDLILAAAGLVLATLGGGMYAMSAF